MKILMAEVNISEGTNTANLEKIKAELLSVQGVELMDYSPDKDHNRTVFTYKGEPEAVLEATKKLAKKSVELIDMRTHQGSHPRMGAVDVVPFIPVRNMTMEDAVEVSKEFGQFMGSMGVPVYYYEDAATKPERKSLVTLRKGQYEALEEKFKQESWKPDEGPFTYNPVSGATVTGARFPLVAFNINLDTQNIEIGNKLVKAVRGISGGFTAVRAIALELPDKNQIQVSMNLTNYTKTPIHRVFETVLSELRRYNVNVVDTELIGPVPQEALLEILQFYIRLGDGFQLHQIY